MADRRIYKFSELYDLFRQKFCDITGLADDFSEGSIVRAMGQSIAFFVNFLQIQIQVAFDSFRIKTAIGEDLANRVADWQITPYESTYAQGDVVFIRTTPAEADFIVPAGSVVSTVEDVYGLTIDYSLNLDTTFPSGFLSTTGTVTCLQLGRDGNVSSGKVTNLKTSISGVDSITNPSPISSGANDETDDQIRKRVPLKLIGLQKGNRSAVLEAAYSIPGVTYANVRNNTPSSGEFTLYFTNYNGIVDSDLRVQVKTAVDAVTDFCIVANYAIPTVINTTIDMVLTIDTNYALTSGSVTGSVRDLIYDFVQINSENVLRVSDLISIVKSVDGILDVTTVEIGGVAANKTVTDFEVIKVVDRNSITFSVA